MGVARYLGFAEEETFNQGTPPAAVAHVDIASASLDSPTDTQMIYSGGLQRSARTHRPGFYSPTGNVVYAFDIRTIGFLLKWALGGYKFTHEGGTGDLNLHEFYGSPENRLPSFCARVGKDYFEHVFSGCAINSLEIQVDGEWCQATADIVAAKDSKATRLELQDLLLSDAYPLAFHEVTASVDGTPKSCEVKSFTISISNNQDADAGRGLGSRHPCRIIAGERETTIDMDLFFENTEALEKLWGGSTGPSTNGSEEFPIVINVDSGDHGHMSIELPRVIYTSVSQQPTGRDEIVQSTSARAFMDTVTLDDGVTEVESEILVGLENEEGVYGAYPGTISGTVTYDDGGLQPLVGATITTDTGETATSIAGGAYTIPNVPSGTRTLTFAAAGYVTAETTDIELAPAGTSTQNKTLVAEE